MLLEDFLNDRGLQNFKILGDILDFDENGNVDYFRFQRMFAMFDNKKSHLTIPVAPNIVAILELTPNDRETQYQLGNAQFLVSSHEQTESYPTLKEAQDRLAISKQD